MTHAAQIHQGGVIFHPGPLLQFQQQHISHIPCDPKLIDPIFDSIAKLTMLLFVVKPPPAVSSEGLLSAGL